MRYTIPTIFLLVRHGAAGVITHGTTGIPLSAIAYAKRGPANLEQTDAIQPPSLATDINTGPIYTCNCMNDDITANHQSTRRCCVEGYINVRDACSGLDSQESEDFSNCCPEGLYFCIGIEDSMAAQ